MKQIPATKGFVILVDDVDYERLSHFRWYAHHSGGGIHRPARRTGRESGRKVLFLVQHVWPFIPEGMVRDHRNGDPWDNQRVNLRVCTNAQNLLNKRRRKQHGPECPHKGVYVRPHCRPFAKISRDGIIYNLGSHDTAELAALAYDSAALYLHRDFASLNFPGAGTIARSPDEILAATAIRQQAPLPPEADEATRLIASGVPVRTASIQAGIKPWMGYQIARSLGLELRRGRPNGQSQAA